MVVPFLQYRENLRAAAENELAEVASLQADADRSGELAFWLLVTSGVVGLTLGAAVSVLIGRSILQPLSSLEATANKVSRGDMTARAPVSGPAELSKLGGALNHMMTAVEERTEELRLSNEELRERNRQLLEARAQAASDALTGLLNHRKFHQKIREVIADAQQSNEAVSLIMLDVDNFKQVNDSLGHLKGDEVLRELSSTIAETAGQDCAYRYGGDEFAVMLTRSGHEDAVRVAKRLLDAVAKNKEAEKVTVSLGVAAYPEMAATAEELIYRADMALNWAKSSGKNRVGDWHALIARKDGEMPAPAENAVDAGIASS